MYSGSGKCIALGSKKCTINLGDDFKDVQKLEPLITFMSISFSETNSV